MGIAAASARAGFPAELAWLEWLGEAMGSTRAVVAVSFVLFGAAVLLVGMNSNETQAITSVVGQDHADERVQMLHRGFYKNMKSCGNPDHPCQDHGNCVLDPVSRGRMGTRYYRCDCMPQWTGVDCDRPLNQQCPYGGTNSECSGHGACLEGGKFGKFACCCDDGWEGEACGKQNPDKTAVGCA